MLIRIFKHYNARSHLRKISFFIPFTGLLLLLIFFIKTAYSGWATDMNSPVVSISAKCGSPPNETVIASDGTCDQTYAYITITYNELDPNDTGLQTITHAITGALDNGTFLQSGATYQYIKQVSNSTSSPVNVTASATDNAGNIGNYTDGVDFTFTFSFTYTINGRVFIDTNGDGIKNGTEENHTDIPNVTLSGGAGTLTNSTGGTFLASGLIGGTPYTVSLNSLPPGYYPTYPNSIPPQYSVSFPCTMGPPPSFSPYESPLSNPPNQPLNASCFGNGIINLNFGITEILPWFQCVGADCRDDDPLGFKDKIPTDSTTTECVAGYATRFASLTGPMSNSSGIIFSGNANPDLGRGLPSLPEWLVGGNLYKEVFNPVRPKVIRTSYSYVNTTLRQSGITARPLSATECGIFGITNCNLSSTLLPNGVYISGDTYPSNLTLVGTGTPATYIFPADKDYVFLVNGDLTINTKIIVPVGSTATFIVKGDITISEEVGDAAATICNPTIAGHPGCHIEGFYSTDKSFKANGNSPSQCPTTSDKRLNIAGAVVINAALLGGSLEYNRDLCSDSLTCPSLSIVERPDFYLNAPELLKHQNYVWQEVAP